MVSVQPVGLLSFTDFASFDAHRRGKDSFFHHTLEQDPLFVRDDDSYRLDKFCAVCVADREVNVSKYLAFPDRGVLMPYWRETLDCVSCRLNNRMRGLLHVMSAEARIPRDASVYLTEQVTATYAAAKQAWPNTTGSEFLRDGTPRGQTNAEGIRSEDMTKLSFAADSFDALATLDVIEHIPDYVAAMREAFRVLKPNGRLILSAPFDLSAEHSLVRARVKPDGEIEHLTTPEYHGDPLDPQGLLCFTTFGWDFLQMLREIGFTDVSMNFYWSSRYGYHGVQYIVLATKPVRWRNRLIEVLKQAPFRR